MASLNTSIRRLLRAANREDGFALMYMAVVLVSLLLISGLAVDTGQAYIVKAQLGKAVDGAALAAARNLNAGDPQGEAARIFAANFPTGYMGSTLASGPTLSVTTDQASGRNIVSVTASATVPTSLMRLANHSTITVASSAEATRRMVDLSLVVDVSDPSDRSGRR